MKRILPATAILIFAIILCFYSYALINRYCDETLQDINDFHNRRITAKSVQENWHARKGKMSFFVNHDFLDKISIYVGQLSNDSNDENSLVIYQNIQTVLSMIRDEQRLSLHSLY